MSGDSLTMLYQRLTIELRRKFVSSRNASNLSEKGDRVGVRFQEHLRAHDERPSSQAVQQSGKRKLAGSVGRSRGAMFRRSVSPSTSKVAGPPTYTTR